MFPNAPSSEPNPAITPAITACSQSYIRGVGSFSQCVLSCSSDLLLVLFALERNGDGFQGCRDLQDYMAAEKESQSWAAAAEGVRCEGLVE